MKQINEAIVGTWWLCSKGGELYLTKGPEAPEKTDGNSWRFQNSAEVGWLWIRDSEGNHVKDSTLNRKDRSIRYESKWFKDLNFPEIGSYECKEIEITKSGKVFTYD